MRFAYGQISKSWLFVRKFERNFGALPKKEKIRANHGTNFKCYSVAYGVMSVRLHTLLSGWASHLA